MCGLCSPQGRKLSYMRMTGYILLKMGNMFPGKLLSSDISPFHQIYDWDVQYPWIRSKPEISVRYRIRLRYPGANDAGIEQSEYEPEACFPAWIVPQEGGQTGLCLEEPSTGQYFIPDMTGLPGLPNYNRMAYPSESSC